VTQKNINHEEHEEHEGKPTLKRETQISTVIGQAVARLCVIKSFRPVFFMLFVLFMVIDFGLF